MILADASIWIDHLRYENALFRRRLDEGKIAIHEDVIGELACGGLRQRAQILRLLDALPRVAAASFDEVMYLIESRKLMGRGIGWADAEILAGCLIGQTQLWTLDSRLQRIAEDLSVAVS